MSRFDYVIVGGGSAASVLAFRLGEAGKSVCVLEAGPPDRNPYIRLPAGFMKTLFDEKVTFQYHHEPTEAVHGRKIHVAQGRTLGGSSAVNGMMYNRGQAVGFDSWAQSGNPGWSYRDVLPYFKRTERAIGIGEDTFRGRDGRLPVEECAWKNDACDAFIEGAEAMGVPRNGDMNGATQAGTGYYQNFIHRGKRWSAAHSFLHPARKRFGVAVRTDAPVTRILLEGKKAVGVRHRKGDGFAEVFASEAVIVSAGTANTAKLLQLSGIGPGEVLRDHGIDVHHALPGVGENFRDHFSPRLVGRAKTGVDSINGRVRGLKLGREIMAWAMNRPTILAIPPMQAYCYWMSDPSMSDPDFAMSFAPASYQAGLIGKLDAYPGVTLGTKQLRPESRGYVRIRSADDRDPPILQPNYIDNEYDRAVVIKALKFARAVLTSGPMARILQEETLPGPQVQTDDEWLDFARRSANSGYHLIGTAKMGPASDPTAVVDARLKVHGLDGLYVADCSIMPTMPSGNTCASAMMVGEKCADMLLDRTALADVA
ncbi:GMC family oxidoreductase [Antarctobacter sp.]|uniref:GMC family oxidoreductase n=1 Tax=Antarctobacter sp. TaxID=1872577 RepID=UPI003A940F0E